MLNRLSSVLQSAADALAPPPPPLEDLKYHWKMVVRFYAQRTIQIKCPVEETNIPAHLEQLLRILISEDSSTKHGASEGPFTTAGPCLEFLLQHRLLELLVSLARADSPPGMRMYLLDYFRRLVTALSPHLLTLASIHLPLLRIILLCSQSKASPTEAEEIGFLLTLCQIVHRHPYLSIIFNKETKPNKQSGSSSSVSSHNHVQVEITTAPIVSSGSATECSPVFSSPPVISKQSQNRTDEPTEMVANTTDGKESTNVSNNENQDLNLRSQLKDSTDCVLGGGSSEVEKSSSVNNCLPVEAGDGYVPTTNQESLARIENSHVSEDVACELSRTTSGSCTPESFQIDDCPELEAGEGKLPLLDAVLGYINSADSVTKLHVCEALLMLVSVADDTFSSAISRASNLGLAMAEKLISSFQEIPADIDPDYFEDIPQNWGPKSSQMWLEEHAFPGSRLIASFVSWLNFCDQLTVESPVEVAESVSGAVRALFFEIELESELRTGAPIRQILITNIICLSLRHITSNIFMSELNSWLMGGMPEDPELYVESSLRNILLNNCLHSNTHLSLNSMRLFELLLENCDEHVLNCLVLKYLANRAYYDASADQDKSYIESWSDEEDAREREGVKKKIGSDASGSTSQTFAPNNIPKIIDRFLQLLPSSLRSATDYQESGYHQYIAEAQRQYSANVQNCSSFGWGTEAVTPAEETVLNQKCQFDEGPFLRMIFARLRGLANQPYEMNLQLTALVSRLAMLPHPHIHEFLLNPLLPLSPGTTSLYCTLQAVACEMQTAVAGIPNSKKMLVRTRHDLLGTSSNHEYVGENNCLLESVIVLEEFCKELAAITYVKYHHSS